MIRIYTYSQPAAGRPRPKNSKSKVVVQVAYFFTKSKENIHQLTPLHSARKIACVRHLLNLINSIIKGLSGILDSQFGAHYKVFA